MKNLFWGTILLGVGWLQALPLLDEACDWLKKHKIFDEIALARMKEIQNSENGLSEFQSDFVTVQNFVSPELAKKGLAEKLAEKGNALICLFVIGAKQMEPGDMALRESLEIIWENIKFILEKLEKGLSLGKSEELEDLLKEVTAISQGNSPNTSGGEDSD